MRTLINVRIPSSSGFVSDQHLWISVPQSSTIVNLQQTVTIISDDRIKHNEVNIENGLSVIRQLQPQKYQKTRKCVWIISTQGAC